MEIHRSQKKRVKSSIIRIFVPLRTVICNTVVLPRSIFQSHVLMQNLNDFSVFKSNANKSEFVDSTHNTQSQYYDKQKANKLVSLVNMSAVMVMAFATVDEKNRSLAHSTIRFINYKSGEYLKIRIWMNCRSWMNSLLPSSQLLRKLLQIDWITQDDKVEKNYVKYRFG